MTNIEKNLQAVINAGLTNVPKEAELAPWAEEMFDLEIDESADDDEVKEAAPDKGMFHPYLNTIQPNFTASVYHKRVTARLITPDVDDFIDSDAFLAAMQKKETYTFTIPNAEFVLMSDEATPDITSHLGHDIIGDLEWQLIGDNVSIPSIAVEAKLLHFPGSAEQMAQAWEEDRRMIIISYEVTPDPVAEYYSNAGKEDVMSWLKQRVEEAADMEYDDVEGIKVNDITEKYLTVEYVGESPTIEMN